MLLALTSPAISVLCAAARTVHKHTQWCGCVLVLSVRVQAQGPCTAQELAAAAGGLSERWVREWLYQGAAARLVCCDSEACR